MSIKRSAQVGLLATLSMTALSTTALEPDQIDVLWARSQEDPKNKKKRHKHGKIADNRRKAKAARQARKR